MHSDGQKIEFIQRIFGQGKLFTNKNGQNLYIICPICRKNGKSPKNPHMAIELSDGKLHCWSCSFKAKNLIVLLAKIKKHHLINECIKIFGLHFHVENEEKNEIAPISLPDDFKMLALSLDSRLPSVHKIISYAYSRGLEEEDLWRFKVGWSEQSEYRNRLIFPSFDKNGILNYFTARDIDNKSKIKYLNCEADKNKIIFNEYLISWDKPILLVEGPMDLVKAGDNTIPLLGSLLSESTAIFKNILINNSQVILCLDNDMKEKQNNIAKILSEYGIEVKILPLGKFHDPGSLTKQDFKKIKEKNSIWWSRSYSLQDKINSIASCSLKI